MTYREFTNSFYLITQLIRLKSNYVMQKIDQDDIIWDKLVEIDLFNPNKKIGLIKQLQHKF